MDIFDKPSQLKIAREFFRGYNTATEVSKTIYIDKKFKKTIGTVTRFVDEWGEKGYLENGFKEIEVNAKKPFVRRITAIRLNLNPYFDYISEKLKYPINKNINSLKLKISDEEQKAEAIKKDLIPARKKLREHQKYLNKKYKIKNLGLKNIYQLDKKLQDKTFNLINKRWNLEKSFDSHKRDIKSLKDFLNEKNRLVKFNFIEKEVIKRIFDNNRARDIVCDYDNVFEGITIFLENIFLHNKVFNGGRPLGEKFVNNFISKNKSYKKRIKYEDLTSKILALTKYHSIKYMLLESKFNTN